MEKQFDLNKVYTEQELASADGAFYKERLEKWKKQRIEKGYCDYDLWDMDAFLMEILVNGLREFADNTHSYPGMPVEGISETPQQWHDFLYHLAAEFEEGYDMMDEIEDLERAKQGAAKVKEAWNTLGEWLHDLWD